MSPGPFAWDEASIREVERNYRDEKSARWTYLALADLDKRPERADLLRELADYEEKHAGAWEQLLRHVGRQPPKAAPFREHRLLVGFARLFGVSVTLPLIHRGEVDGIAKYKDQRRRWTDPEAERIFQRLMPEEVSHEVDLFREMRETGGSRGALRSAILGANDGLGSVLALAAGVAGATIATDPNSSVPVLIAGVAGLVAGAVSMAASNYVSVKAEQEAYASQVRLERDALEVAGDAKRQQLERAYRAKGLPEKEAKEIVARISENREGFLKVLLAEEHGIAETSFEKPGRLSLVTGLAFILAGSIPLIPFLFLPPFYGVIASVAFTAIALFFAGVIRALSTLNPFLRSGIEMMLIGMGAAIATYLVGLAVGTTV